MTKIDMVFNNLEKWKDLPSYQLERRADIFFSLYLTKVLSKELPKAISTNFIPEFPLKQGDSNRSDKVDYLAVSKDGTEAYLVELKTDPRSIRVKQCEYLCKAAKKDLRKLVADVKGLQGASRAGKKYDALIELMRLCGLDPDGKTQLPKTVRVVLIQPSETVEERILECFAKEKVGFTNISFSQFLKVVEKDKDPLSQRFAEFLASW